MEKETKVVVQSKNIFGLMAVKYNLNEVDFKKTINATLMPTDRNGKLPSDEDVAAFLIVANQYNLNPFTNEIYAYPNKTGGITPVVGVDGFLAIMNNHKSYNGLETIWAEDEVIPEGGKTCPKWCEIKIWRKNLDKPVVVREYLDEVYVPARGEHKFAGPWQTHTKRMLRHKTIVQAARVAFGITGVYDEDEAGRISEGQVIEAQLVTLKPDVKQPQALPEVSEEKEKPKDLEENFYKTMIGNFSKARKKVGDEFYYQVLGEHGYEHSNQIRKLDEGAKLLEIMHKEFVRLESIRKEQGGDKK